MGSLNTCVGGKRCSDLFIIILFLKSVRNYSKCSI
jgi:hypothetical protein